MLDLKEVVAHNADEQVVEDATGTIQVLECGKKFLFALVRDAKGQEHELFVKSGLCKNSEDKFFNTRSWDTVEKEMVRKGHGIVVQRPKKSGRRKQIDSNSLYHQLQQRLRFTEKACQVTLVKLRRGYSRLSTFRMRQIQVLRDAGATAEEKQKACKLLLPGYKSEGKLEVVQLLDGHGPLDELLQLTDPDFELHFELEESGPFLFDDESVFHNGLESPREERLYAGLLRRVFPDLFDRVYELLEAHQRVLEAEKKMSHDMESGFTFDVERIFSSTAVHFVFHGLGDHIEGWWRKIQEVKVSRERTETLTRMVPDDVARFVHSLVWTNDVMQNKNLHQIHTSSTAELENSFEFRLHEA